MATVRRQTPKKEEIWFARFRPAVCRQAPTSGIPAAVQRLVSAMHPPEARLLLGAHIRCARCNFCVFGRFGGGLGSPGRYLACPIVVCLATDPTDNRLCEHSTSVANAQLALLATEESCLGAPGGSGTSKPAGTNRVAAKKNREGRHTRAVLFEAG